MVWRLAVGATSNQLLYTHWNSYCTVIPYNSYRINTALLFPFLLLFSQVRKEVKHNKAGSQQSNTYDYVQSVRVVIRIGA